MRRLRILLPEKHIKDLDWLVKQKYYKNREEAIMFAVKDLLDKYGSFEFKSRNYD